MSSVDVSGESAADVPPVKAGEFRLEVVVLPVSDVDRAKEFYGSLGWRLDADVARGEDFRLVQFTRRLALTVRSSLARISRRMRPVRFRVCI
jgi:hypothetical protein